MSAQVLLLLMAGAVIALGEIIALTLSVHRYRTGGLDRAAQVYCTAIPAILLLAAVIVSLGLFVP
jgi:hypothetical protein